MAELPQSSNGVQEPFTDILKQINFEDPKELAKKETGEKISQKLWRDQTGNSDSLNYFSARAIRWVNILKWATGTQDMREFLDFFNISTTLGNKAYVKIDMAPVMVGPQFVGTLVESMAKNEEYPCVTAIDDDSMKEKEDRYQEAIFRMREVETIDELQQQSGMVLEDPAAYVPDNELAAKVYFELEDRLPKEIKFEKKLENILIYNQYDRVLKRKILYDFVVHNIGVTKIEKEPNGKYCIRKCIPQNMFYNFFIGDTGRAELSYIGEGYKLKVRDIRLKYGMSPQNPKGLTEREIYEIAKVSNTNNNGVGFPWAWKEEYTLHGYQRPWDDYGVYVIDYEIQVGESEYYVSKRDGYGKENIAPKKGIPEPKSEKAVVHKKSKTRWYRGVYAPFANKLIYWGLPDLIIFPYNNYEYGLSSYTINIPFNNGEYVPSLFERAMEPLKEYAITKLKRKQLIAKLRPSGIRIDVESARNLDLGQGNTIPWEEVIRIYDQTGNELWSSAGMNPNEKATPSISPTAQDDTVQKIIQLTAVLEACINDIRQLLGVPMYRDGSDVGDRTAAKLADMQNTSSFNVTDFIANANNQLMEETLYKCCLLEWQDVVKSAKETSEDLINTRFNVTVQMKQTAYEKQLLEQNIAIWSKVIDPSTGKPVLTPKDAFKIRNIKNGKMAEWYLASVIESNERKAEEDKAKREQANIQAQQQSVMIGKQEEAKMLDAKLSAEKDMKDWESRQKKEQIVLTGVMELLKLSMTPSKEGGENGGTTPPPKIPDFLMPLVQQTIQNVAIPMVQENQQMQQEIVMNQMQQQMALQQMAQQQPEMQEQQMQGAPV